MGILLLITIVRDNHIQIIKILVSANILMIHLTQRRMGHPYQNNYELMQKFILKATSQQEVSILYIIFNLKSFLCLIRAHFGRGWVYHLFIYLFICWSYRR